MASFLSFRTNLDREYSKKLSEQTAKARQQALKDQREEKGQASTLHNAYLKVLESADWDARDHLALADSIGKEVVDSLQVNGTTLEGIRKKVSSFKLR